MSAVKKRLTGQFRASAVPLVRAGLGSVGVRVLFELLDRGHRYDLAERAVFLACVGEWPEEPLPVNGCGSLRYRDVNFRRRANGYWMADKTVNGRRHRAYVGKDLTRSRMDAAVRRIECKRSGECE